MDNIQTVKSKQLALNAIRDNEAAIAAKIDQMVANSGGDSDTVSGCGRLFNFFRFAQPSKRSNSSSERTQTKAEAAVFGKRGKSLSANERLDQAAESVSAHALQLGERASAARDRARSLAASGKRNEALMALKRAKVLDKQAENATATHAAIEAQKDLLDGQELQREIASALAASVATTKTKTKGLLTKTENAVDDMEEMRDAFEEVGQVLGGLQSGNDVDDDDLAAELDAMVASNEAEVAPEGDAAVAMAIADLKAAAEVEESFPPVPRKKKEEKLGLLVNDSASM